MRFRPKKPGLAAGPSSPAGPQSAPQEAITQDAADMVAVRPSTTTVTPLTSIPDDDPWTYDNSWLGTATFEDMTMCIRRPNAFGSNVVDTREQFVSNGRACGNYEGGWGGLSCHLDSFWSLPCVIGDRASVLKMFQIDRYFQAQQKARELLAARRSATSGAALLNWCKESVAVMRLALVSTNTKVSDSRSFLNMPNIGRSHAFLPVIGSRLVDDGLMKSAAPWVGSPGPTSYNQLLLNNVPVSNRTLTSRGNLVGTKAHLLFFLPDLFKFSMVRRGPQSATVGVLSGPASIEVARTKADFLSDPFIYIGNSSTTTPGPEFLPNWANSTYGLGWWLPSETVLEGVPQGWVQGIDQLAAILQEDLEHLLTVDYLKWVASSIALLKDKLTSAFSTNVTPDRAAVLRRLTESYDRVQAASQASIATNFAPINSFASIVSVLVPVAGVVLTVLAVVGQTLTQFLEAGLARPEGSADCLTHPFLRILKEDPTRPGACRSDAEYIDAHLRMILTGRSGTVTGGDDRRRTPTTAKKSGIVLPAAALAFAAWFLLRK